jgi:hypothetical protein
MARQRHQIFCKIHLQKNTFAILHHGGQDLLSGLLTGWLLQSPEDLFLFVVI